MTTTTSTITETILTGLATATSGAGSCVTPALTPKAALLGSTTLMKETTPQATTETASHHTSYTTDCSTPTGSASARPMNGTCAWTAIQEAATDGPTTVRMTQTVLTPPTETMNA